VKINNPLPPSKKSPYITNFEFVGTIDNAPYLCIPKGLEYRESIGGEAAIYAYNHKLAREAGQRVAKILGTEVLENKEGTLGNCCFTNVKLPLKLEEVISVANIKEIGVPVVVWVGETLVKEYGTFMALIFYGNAWWVRLSAQIYLELEDFEWAAAKLKEVCERVMKGEFLQANS
jgi:selenocysteine lyase/cysteine desulfurase